MLITYPYICPITLTTMKDPVLASDGYSYERNAITKWINENGNSPETKQEMTLEDIIPNDALRDILHKQTPKLPLKDDKLYHALDYAYSTKLSSYMTSTKIPSDKSDKDQMMVHIDSPDIDISNTTSLIDTTADHHICCVIDISGSMKSPAISKNENGSENDLGLSVLDVVKFATLVVAKSLRPQDQLSIVTFTDKADVILNPTSMDDTGKQNVETLLKTVQPKGSTNLWDGIKKSIELTHQVDSKYISSIFVLTDGIPNMHPALGYTHSIKRILQSKSIFGSLSTFGFGYSLDSSLLKHIAKLGGGTFSFIPDSGFVGTSIINAIANARCAYGIHPYLCIKTKRPMESKTNNVTLDGQFRISNSTEGYVCVHMLPLRHGASMNIILRENIIELMEKIQNYPMELVFHIIGNRLVRIPITFSDANKKKDTFYLARAHFLKNISKILSKATIDSSDYIFQKTDITFFKTLQNDNIDALLQDFEGQVCEALSKNEWYKTWGKHYLHSLTEAHLHQICNNFKDPGVQIYGKGQLFTYLQEELNDIFEQIPAPKPSIQPPLKLLRGPGSMSSAYNSRCTVCMHGKTMLTIQTAVNNLSRRLDQIQKGDFVLTESGTFVKVACVIETVINLDHKNPLQMIQIGNLVVTPYHPIKLTNYGKWSFPMDIPQGKMIKYRSKTDLTQFSVYNLILEQGQRQNAIVMDGIACITLGHGIANDSVLQHPYFGTDRIVTDIVHLDPNGWKLGHVVLYEKYIKRNPNTGLIDNVGQTNYSKSLSVY